MDKRKEAFERALQDLTDMKNHKANYGIINKYQHIINTFAEMEQVCDRMAEDIAEAKGKSKEEVFEEYYGKV